MTRTHFIAFVYSFNYHQLYQYAVTPSSNILNISPLNIRMNKSLHSQKINILHGTKKGPRCSVWSFFLQAAPVDGIESVLDEIGVGTGKWTAAEKSAAGRKRAWVWAFDDMVAMGVDESDLCFARARPRG